MSAYLRQNASSVRVVAFAALILLLLALHHDTYISIVIGWSASTTYNHGYAIPFIAAFFAWRSWRQSGHAVAVPCISALLLVVALISLWAVASAANIQVIVQLASVAMIPAVYLSLSGPRRTAAYALPFLYLLFAVPFGEGIVPHLMEWTADFTVGALNLFGIPVLRDGLFFSTANGNFEVAKACSGVRYLLAAAAAGTAFAFLTFESGLKRILFILASLLVPIVANGLRAFGIVLIAHYSDMRLAVGVDHFIYGWVFFGFVMFLLFAIGSRFADDVPLLTDSRQSPTGGPHNPRKPEAISGRFLVVVVALALLIATGPDLVGAHTEEQDRVRVGLPVLDVQGTSGPNPARLEWRMAFRDASADIANAYAADGETIEVRVSIYRSQDQGSELINSLNSIAESPWRSTSLGTRRLRAGSPEEVQVARVSAAGTDLLVWYWYQYGERTTASNYGAKWIEVLSVFERTPGLAVAIGTEYDDEAESRLMRFLQSKGKALVRCLGGAAAEFDCADTSEE